MVIGSFDLILLLDILHYLDEEQLTATLVRCRRLLDPGGRLVIRFVIPPPLRKSPAWHFEDWRCRWTGLVPHYRHPEQLRDRMAEHGFVNVRLSPTADSELFWIVGYASEKKINKSGMRSRLSWAETCGIVALTLAAPLAWWQPALAVVPLTVFVGLCVAAPFFRNFPSIRRPSAGAVPALRRFP